MSWTKQEEYWLTVLKNKLITLVFLDKSIETNQVPFNDWRMSPVQRKSWFHDDERSAVWTILSGSELSIRSRYLKKYFFKHRRITEIHIGVENPENGACDVFYKILGRGPNYDVVKIKTKFFENFSF